MISFNGIHSPDSNFKCSLFVFWTKSIIENGSQSLRERFLCCCNFLKVLCTFWLGFTILSGGCANLENTLNNIFVSAIWCNRFCLFLSCVTFCGPPIVECGRKTVRVKAPVHPHLMSMGGREGQPPDFYWILIGFLSNLIQVFRVAATRFLLNTNRISFESYPDF